ncbi:MAG: nicotinamide-nucleotide amidohydrolase family protein [Firmicutes bacterium]|nr:nicotinamide-nucleotide amidohydrolase family protein [Bacillota bacterium]
MNEIVFAVMEKALKKELSIATAESCTGGKVAAALIGYAGASDIYKEGFVTYSNEAKMKRLGVNEKTLSKYGAVSEQTAREMAEGAANAANADIGLSTTGIAGPGGGTAEKPVGLVYIGVSVKGNTTVKKLNLSGDRETVRNSAVKEILTLLDSLI